MANHELSIKTYAVGLTRLRGWTFGAEAKGLSIDEWIQCRGPNNELVRVFFVLNDPIPKSFIAPNGNWFAFMPARQYPHAIDLLRNESPIRCVLDSSTGRFELWTSDEPVGERPGEGRRSIPST